MIGRHGDAFVERNAALHLLLGMASASRTLDRILARHGRSAGSPARPPSREDEHLVDFLLGVVAFQRRLVAILDAARVPAREAPPAPREPAPGGLLR